MDLSVSDENILGHITEFKEIHDEYTTIQNEIKNFRKKYEKRIKELKLTWKKRKRYYGIHENK